MVSGLASQLRPASRPPASGLGAFFAPRHAAPNPAYHWSLISRLSLRSYYWGSIVIVVASGELDGRSSNRLAPYLRRLQEGNDLIVDLWDITTCDADGIAILAEAKQRADESGWGFAVVIDPAGPVGDALEAADIAIPMFHDRHSARAAMQQAPS